MKILSKALSWLMIISAFAIATTIIISAFHFDDYLLQCFLYEISIFLISFYSRDIVDAELLERKSKKQDFTPTSISNLVAKLVGKDNSTYYEPAAGTGSMLIAKWHNDRLKNPLYKRPETDNPLIKFLTSPTFTYDPRAYWYQAEELSDRAIPFLIFNMSIRGMNGSITQCDCLSRKATRAFFIRNNTSNYLGFSEVIELPKNQEVADLLGVHWDK